MCKRILISVCILAALAVGAWAQSVAGLGGISGARARRLSNSLA